MIPISTETFEAVNISKLLSDFWGESSILIDNCIVIPENSLELYRWKTLLIKEPETIEWIRNMDNSSILLDIGANIGIYTLTALVKGVSRVISFEPYYLNFKRLVANVETNNLMSSAYLFCTAIFDKPCILYFSHSNPDLSGIAEFDQNIHGQPNSYPVLCLPGSSFDSISEFAHATHLKIDVDGPELSVLKGCHNLLLRPSLQSVLIECSIEATESSVISIMNNYSFEIDDFYESMSNHSSHRRRKEPGNVARNLVFKRVAL